MNTTTEFDAIMAGYDQHVPCQVMALRSTGWFRVAMSGLVGRNVAAALRGIGGMTGALRWEATHDE